MRWRALWLWFLDADEFVIMACDGVWDVMGNDEACFFLRKCIQEGARDLGQMLEKMEVFIFGVALTPLIPAKKVIQLQSQVNYPRARQVL